MSDQQKQMTAAEFTDAAIAAAREGGITLCREQTEEFARQLVERGVLAEDEQPRRMEVDGITMELEGPELLMVRDPDGRGQWLNLRHLPALARALALWCGEEQPQPQPAQGTRERPYIWRRRTEDGGSEEVPVWLEGGYGQVYLYAGDPDTGGAIAASFQASGTAYLTDYRGEQIFSRTTQPTPPPEGEVVLRLSREEARCLADLFVLELASGERGGMAEKIRQKVEAVTGAPKHWRLDKSGPFPMLVRR